MPWALNACCSSAAPSAHSSPEISPPRGRIVSWAWCCSVPQAGTDLPMPPSVKRSSRRVCSGSPGWGRKAWPRICRPECSRSEPQPRRGHWPPGAPRASDRMVIARRRGLLANGRLIEDARKYPGPALVIAGTQDDITPAAGSERIARAFPRGTFRLIENAGHLCHLDTPAVVSSAIADMAQRCLEGAYP